MPNAAAFVATLLVSLACLGSAQAIDYSKPVRSLYEIRSEGVVMQQWDNSCGAAALTTVLRFRLGLAIDERTTALEMLKAGDIDAIKVQGGFSFLDLARFAEKRGFKVDGYKDLDVETLGEFPFAIVPIIEYGRVPHFIVIRKIENGVLDIADPAFGNRTLSSEEFQSIWQNQVALIVEKRK